MYVPINSWLYGGIPVGRDFLDIWKFEYDTIIPNRVCSLTFSHYYRTSVELMKLRHIFTERCGLVFSFPMLLWNEIAVSAVAVFSEVAYSEWRSMYCRDNCQVNQFRQSYRDCGVPSSLHTLYINFLEFPLESRISIQTTYMNIRRMQNGKGVHVSIKVLLAQDLVVLEAQIVLVVN